MTSTAECHLSRSQPTCISTVLFLLTLPVACIWRSCLEEHRRAVVAGPCPLPSLPARWASGCNFEFLFFRTKVCAPYGFVSSAELEVPGAGECLVLRTVLITRLFSCLSTVSGVRALFRSKGMKTVAKPDLACCFPCHPHNVLLNESMYSRSRELQDLLKR